MNLQQECESECMNCPATAYICRLSSKKFHFYYVKQLIVDATMHITLWAYIYYYITPFSWTLLQRGNTNILSAFSHICTQYSTSIWYTCKNLLQNVFKNFVVILAAQSRHSRWLNYSRIINVHTNEQRMANDSGKIMSKN